VVAILLLVNLPVFPAGALEDDLLLWERRLLEESEIVYVGETFIEFGVQFKNDWLEFSVEIVGGPQDLPWSTSITSSVMSGQYISMLLTVDQEAKIRHYNATIYVNATNEWQTYRKEYDLVVDFRRSLEVKDVYLVRGDEYVLRLELEAFVQCRELEIWFVNLPGHTIETDFMMRRPIRPGRHVFETVIKPRTILPDTTPENVSIEIRAETGSHVLFFFMDWNEPRLVIKEPDDPIDLTVLIPLIALLAVIVLILLFRRRKIEVVPASMGGAAIP
jgi:hypothetical protein